MDTWDSDFMATQFGRLSPAELDAISQQAAESAKEWLDHASTAPEEGSEYPHAWASVFLEVVRQAKTIRHNRFVQNGIPCDCGLCSMAKPRKRKP